MREEDKKVDVETVEAEAVDPENEVGAEMDNDEVLELQNKLARLQADFVNYKNRVEKSKSDYIAQSNANLIESLLPVLDNFERAFDSVEEEDREDEFVKGMALIREGLIDALKKEGLEEIDSDGAPFDPNLHHAILMEESETVAPEHITETFQKGYVFNGKVIRPSMVKVCK